ncbi:uncharacterized protein LOC132543360 [Ylistrum balloti]|uniref:uncharacterized protein LOC132543360 n=1 Tax=Ylistrum balloti TaxID=509963 RepID=UPI002905AECE|nr:uncharacterized protein LOC132543360 [Ylistrum balloti]
MPGFNACNKLLQKYEDEKAYRIHKRKLNESRTRLDTKSPKKYPHVIVRLKRIQQEEERQAEVDHENKVLLQKMTHIMKNRPEIDNWNEYEPKSLNYGSREKMLREIQMQNIGIARRLDRAQPVYKNKELENEYQQKRYLQALWAENAKEFGQVTPRHLKYRQLKKQHEVEEEDENYDDEDEPFHHHNVIAKNKALGLPPIENGKSNSKQVYNMAAETNIRYMKETGGSSSDPYKQGKGPEKLPRLDRKVSKDTRPVKSDNLVEVNSNKDADSTKKTESAKTVETTKNVVLGSTTSTKKTRSPRKMDSSKTVNSVKTVVSTTSTKKSDSTKKVESAKMNDDSSTKNADSAGKGLASAKTIKSLPEVKPLRSNPCNEHQWRFEVLSPIMSYNNHMKMYIPHRIAKYQPNHRRQRLTKHRDRSRGKGFTQSNPVGSVCPNQVKTGKIVITCPGPLRMEQDINPYPGLVSKGVETPHHLARRKEMESIHNDAKRKANAMSTHNKHARKPVSTQLNLVGKDKVVSTHPNQVGKGKAVSTHPDQVGMGKAVSTHPDQEGRGKAVSTHPDQEGLGKVVSTHPDQEGKGKAVSTHPDQEGKGKAVSTHPDQEGMGKAVSTHPDQEGIGKVVSTHPDQEGKGKAVSTHPEQEGIGKVVSTHPDQEGKGKAVSTHPDQEGRGKAVSTHPDQEGKGKVVSTRPDLLGRDNPIVRPDKKGKSALNHNIMSTDHINSESVDIGNIESGSAESALSQVESSDDGEGFRIGVSIKGIDEDRVQYIQVSNSDQALEQQKDRETLKQVISSTELSSDLMASQGVKKSKQLVRMDSGNYYQPVGDSNSMTKGYEQSGNGLSSLSFLTRSEGSLGRMEKYHDDSRSETTEGGRTNRSDQTSIQGDKRNPQQAQTDNDAKQLFNASKLIGRVHPEDIIIRTCVRRNQKQRMKTKARFEELYELELIPELKSGLGASWFLIIDALLDERTTSSSRAIHDALEEGSYSTVVEILCFTTQQSLATLNDLYNKDYAVSLEEDITDKTDAPEQTLLLALHQGRDESVKVVEKEAEKDADSLYESGDGRWSSDTGPFIKMVRTRNFAHIRVVLNLYRVLTGGKDVTEDIKSECARQYADCLITMVNCVRGADTYFADKIFKNMSAKDQDFVNMLVARSEIDMPTIKRAYKKKYDAELVDDLKHKCNHPTINVLIELINKIPQGQGKKSKPPVPVGAAKRPIKRPPLSQTKEEEANTPRNPLAAPSQRITAEVVSQRQGQEIAREKEKEAREREKGLKKEKEMMKKNISGTVKPSKSFHPDDDCDKLHDAVGKYGTDEAQIMEILTQRCNAQRQQIRKLYSSKFKQDLQKDLERVLQGDYEEILLGLLQTPAEYDAHSVHEALDGMGTRDGTMLGIIVTRDKQEKKAIADHYKKAYKTDVESDLRKEDANSDFADLLVAVWSGDRETGPVNQARAQQEAKMLLKDGKAVHPKGETFINLMVKSSHVQVKAAFQEYERLAGQDIFAGLITAGLGEDEDGYISLAMAVQDPHDFYAEKLNSCFSSMGVNDNMLIRMTVSHAEKDLGDIKTRLQQRHKKSLSQLIRSECKGDYKQMLLEIVGE